jgi:hypothetical protein
MTLPVPFSPAKDFDEADANFRRIASELPVAGIKVKAGIPSDADYGTAPAIGTLVLDTTNSRLYVRFAAASWKYTALT